MSTQDARTPPPGWPVPDVTFVEAVKRGFAQYIGFDGRASRREFWYFYLFAVGVLLVLLAPTIALGVATSTPASGSGGPGAVLTVGFSAVGLFYAAVLLPMLAVACRRLHDAGFSGLFLLLGLVTGLIPLVMCAFPTAPDAVRFNPGAQRLPGPGYPYAGPQDAYGAPAAAGYGQPDPRGDGQTDPQGLGQSAPQGYGQTAPQGYGQTAPQGYGQTAPQGYGQTAPEGYGQGHGYGSAPQEGQPWSPSAAPTEDQPRRD